MAIVRGTNSVVLLALTLIVGVAVGCDASAECPVGFGEPSEQGFCTPSETIEAEVASRIETGYFGYVAFSDADDGEDTCDYRPTTLVPNFSFELVQFDPATSTDLARIPVQSDAEGRWEVAVDPAFAYRFDVDVFNVLDVFEPLAQGEVRFVLVLDVKSC